MTKGRGSLIREPDCAESAVRHRDSMDNISDLEELSSFTATAQVTVLLGDFVRAVDGKLDVLGAGWDTMRLDTPAPFGIGMLVDVLPAAATRFAVELWLEDADGRQVLNGDGNPIHMRVDVETSPPPDRGGVPLTVPLAVNFSPLTGLDAGRYRFVAAVDGRTRPHWSRSFSIVAPAV